MSSAVPDVRIYYSSSLSNLHFCKADLKGKLEQTSLPECCFSPDTSRYLMITRVSKWCKRWIDWASWKGCLDPTGKRQGTEWVGKGMALSERGPAKRLPQVTFKHQPLLLIILGRKLMRLALHRPMHTWLRRAELSPVLPNKSKLLVLPGRKWVQALKKTVAGHSPFMERSFDVQLSLCPIKKQG